jgi:acetate kinase
VAAIKNGKSVDTSMGMTPLEGLVMGTRCGDLDPQLPTYFMETLKMDAKAVDKALNKQSGLLGICGFNDSRDVEDHMAKGDEMATLAFNMFCRRLKKYIGSYIAVMGGVDAIVFTAGIGENSDLTRLHTLKDMEFMGIKLNMEVNHGRCKEPTDVASADSKVRVYVIPTNEELVIARDTKKLVEGK